MLATIERSVRDVNLSLSHISSGSECCHLLLLRHVTVGKSRTGWLRGEAFHPDHVVILRLQVKLYFPVLLTLKFVFFIGLLKVGRRTGLIISGIEGGRRYCTSIWKRCRRLSNQGVNIKTHLGELVAMLSKTIKFSTCCSLRLSVEILASSRVLRRNINTVITMGRWRGSNNTTTEGATLNSQGIRWWIIGIF